MDLGVTGKRAMVLASSCGFGLVCAQALADEGAHILPTGWPEDAGSDGASAITERGPGRADTVLVDDAGGPPPGCMACADPAIMPV